MSSGSETAGADADGKVGKRRGSGEDNDEDPLVIDEENEKSSSAAEAKENNVEDDGTSNPDEDNEKEFEPTVDMLMNEFDDEATIEEEEALAEDDEGKS